MTEDMPVVRTSQSAVAIRHDQFEIGLVIQMKRAKSRFSEGSKSRQTSLGI